MSDNKIFNPTRLRFARKRRCLSIKALGEKIGITSRTISDYENERSIPQSKTLSLLANALHFPESFFFLDDIEPIKDSTVSFRSLARTTAAIRNAALHAGQIALELSSWLDQRFDTPSPNLPDLDNYSPAAAAAVVRNEWALGETSVKNLIHLLEANGTRVFSLVEDTMDMDAFSFWRNERPFVFLNTKKSVERSRFDAAHELGHLVLHKHGAPKGKEAEAEANQFASAFLMPEASIRAHSVNYPTFDWIISEKKIWKVSASALVRRLKDLGLLTEWHYRSIIVNLSQSGYLKNEPSPILERETSKLFPMVFQALREEGIGKSDIARDLGCFQDEIDALIFNLAITSVNGGGIDQKDKGNKDRSHLTVIK